MTVLVIDASVYVSRLHRHETRHVESVRLLDDVAARRVTVLCPEILVPAFVLVLVELGRP